MKIQRVAVILAVAALSLVVFPGSAQARTVVYWGYNNLTASNPPAGTCPTWPAGFACSGFGNWDYSQVDWNSGSGTFIIGFICTADDTLNGRLHGDSDPKGTYTELWSTWCPGHYNKAAVAHDHGTYNYLQARALVFP